MSIDREALLVVGGAMLVIALVLIVPGVWLARRLGRAARRKPGAVSLTGTGMLVYGVQVALVIAGRVAMDLLQIGASRDRLMMWVVWIVVLNVLFAPIERWLARIGRPMTRPLAPSVEAPASAPLPGGTPSDGTPSDGTPDDAPPR